MPEGWWALADALLPGSDGLPRPSAVDDADDWTNRLMAVRPDLRGAARDASETTEDPVTYLARLRAHAPDRFLALATLVAGAHYLNPVVRQRIGYPGQQPVALDEPEDGLDERLLHSVRHWEPSSASISSALRP